jgi:hypothetical protein
MAAGDTSARYDNARFYVFRVTDKRVRPSPTSQEIEKAVSNAKLMQRLDAIRAEIKINAADAEWLSKVPGKISGSSAKYAKLLPLVELLLDGYGACHSVTAGRRRLRRPRIPPAVIRPMI